MDCSELSSALLELLGGTVSEQIVSEERRFSSARSTRAPYPQSGTTNGDFLNTLRTLSFIGGTLLVLATTACTSGQAPAATSAATAVSQSASPEASTPAPPQTSTSGSRANPAPINTPVKYADDSIWTFTLGSTDADAGPEIAEENTYNAAANSGNVYVTVPVHLLVEDSDKVIDGADPWASFGLEYVTASGNSFDAATCSVVLPAPGALVDLGTMYGGAEADFLGCAQAPAADVAGGTWRVSSLVTPSSFLFFAGA